VLEDFSTVDALPEAVQDRLARILDDYLIAIELGNPIAPEELLARHPDDAPQLQKYLSGLQLFHAAAAVPNLASEVSLASGKLQPDQTIGDFRLVREIGRGGMGVVYEAEQISLRRRVALKILPFTAGSDDKQTSRFKNEARAAAQIKHPNIVPVFAVGEQNGIHYYAMQLIEGRSLTAALAELQPTAPASTMDTGAHIRRVAELGVQAAEALEAAHDFGIVHRDVKPSNLLVDGDAKLWVTDFGLARCREQKGLTQTGDVLGTMRYMSPEQATGQGGLVDHRTDIYSLGVTLYELATLHHPAGDATDAQLLLDRRRNAIKPPRHWNRHIPVDFETILLKAISEFPHERYATARKLADDLNRFLEGRPILASPPSLVTRAGKWIGRHRGLMHAAAAVLLVAIVGQLANTVMLSVQKRETEQALATAKANLQQAHAVLEQFGTRYPEQLVAIPGAEGVRAQMLEDSLKFYDRFAAQAADDPTLAGDRALAYNRMGTLSEELGNSQQALAKHEAARAIWLARLADDPSNSDATRNLALCDNNIALLLAARGREAEAIDLLERAQRAQETLRAKDGQAVAVATELATTRNNLGLVLRQAARPREAMQQFRAAIPLVNANENEEAALRVLAAAYNNLGSLLDGAPDEAAENYRRAIDIQQKLAKANSINRLYQGDLARTYNNLGFVLARQRDWSNAEDCYLNAVELQEHLVKQSPLAGSYVRDLAISYNNLGMVQSRAAQFAAAEKSFRKALALNEQLLAATPNDEAALSNVGGVYNNLGLLLAGQHRYADAETAYQSAIRLQKQAFEAAPTSRRYRDLLDNHFANFAACLREQSKQDAAEQLLAESKSLLAQQPTSAHIKPQN
jgi:eukaryotic-like serine/threonine-protein kinase